MEQCGVGSYLALSRRGGERYCWDQITNKRRDVLKLFPDLSFEQLGVFILILFNLFTFHI